MNSKNVYDQELWSPVTVTVTAMPLSGSGHRRGSSDFAISRRTRNVVEKSAAQRRLAQVIANNPTPLDDVIFDDDEWDLGLQFGPPPSLVCIRTSLATYQ
ncbi:hypothetical protein SOVF_039950 [Spinacia oleracea]|nr:hypothetical protein SOVF_039950 [Spinacia oleracea]